MRYRDISHQIKMFIRFAPKGTSPAVLIKEAKELHRRLEVFKNLDPSGVRKLQSELERIIKSLGQEE
jgi:hypothetical protein